MLWVFRSEPMPARRLWRFLEFEALELLLRETVKAQEATAQGARGLRAKNRKHWPTTDAGTSAEGVGQPADSKRAKEGIDRPPAYEQIAEAVSPFATRAQRPSVGTKRRLKVGSPEKQMSLGLPRAKDGQSWRLSRHIARRQSPTRVRVSKMSCFIEEMLERKKTKGKLSSAEQQSFERASGPLFGKKLFRQREKMRAHLQGQHIARWTAP